MCWCTEHYVGHTIRERYFSPLVESEPLCDSNAIFSAAEWAIATATVATATPCVRRNPFCFPLNDSCI